MSSRTIDQACEILRKTNDGDDLAPWHLKLLEMADGTARQGTAVGNHETAYKPAESVLTRKEAYT